jgi:hypothetical protein
METTIQRLRSALDGVDVTGGSDEGSAEEEVGEVEEGVAVEGGLVTLPQDKCSLVEMEMELRKGAGADLQVLIALLPSVIVDIKRKETQMAQ